MPDLYRHHTRDRSYRDCNFYVTFSFWDILFDSHHCPKDQWPQAYGLEEGPIGEFYVKHMVAPSHPLPDVRK